MKNSLILYSILATGAAFLPGCVHEESSPQEVVTTGDPLSRYVDFARHCDGRMESSREIADLVDADDVKVRKVMRRLIREFAKSGKIQLDLMKEIQKHGTLLEYRMDSLLTAKSGTLKSADTMTFTKPVKNENTARRVTGAKAKNLGSGAWHREEEISCRLVTTTFPGKDLWVHSRGGDEDVDPADRAFTYVQMIERGSGGKVSVARYIKPSVIKGEVVETSPVFTVDQWLP
ncbi:hypothetical protein EBZ80_16040 [bacterium]|nr:hypothetical protein [bacterium]